LLGPAGQCLDLSRRNGEDEDEAPARRARDLVHLLVARSLPWIRSATRRNIGGLHEHEQPANSTVGGFHEHEQPANSTVSTFFSSSESNHQNPWRSDGSVVSGIKTRMHARRTKHRRPHYWSDRPLRPIGGRTGSDTSRDAKPHAPEDAPILPSVLLTRRAMLALRKGTQTAGPALTPQVNA
jgi:hypothetical protein